MPKNNNNKSFEIALSGISCALAVIFLSLGILSGVLLATGYCLGIVALMLPLSKKFYFGDFFAYLGTCVLTFILGAAAKFWDLVPFIMFFGMHPLVNSLQVKFKINKILAFIVKAAWFDATLVVGYLLVFGGLLGGSFLPAEVYDFINSNIYILIFTVGTAIFFVYDIIIFRCQAAVNYLMYRIRK